MSHAWSWRHAILQSDLPATTKHLLLVISCHMNDVGEGCYPSVKRLAQLASLTERSVCTHIETAESAGWLTVIRHGLGGQAWARHEYRPSWPKGTEGNSAPPAKGTEPLSEGTEPDDRKALNVVQSNIPDEHSKEHSTLFETWWQVYGRKGSRRQAEDQWRRLKLTPIADQVMEGTHRYLRSRRVQNGYKQDGFRWLRDRGWEAEWEGTAIRKPLDMSTVPF